MKQSGFILFCTLIAFLSHAQTTPDSVTVPASLKYRNPSLFRQAFLGNNYRKEWETPVRLPVFYLKNFPFRITELGGGQQTKSLQFEDNQRRTWVLRTVDKDVEKAVSPKIRGTFAQRVVQDMVSAAHPYAPLTIPTLANAINVVAPAPTFYFVPAGAGLGQYDSLFANSVCMLEQREPTPDRSKTANTEKLVEKIIEENDHQVIQTAVLRARLLDMLVGDWDRHADQWRWGKIDSGKVEWYYAIPRDRDQAYFDSKGLLVKVARKISLRHMIGFRPNLNKLADLNYKAWNFDRVFLNELGAAQWEQTIKEVQTALTDEVIRSAMRKMPADIYALSGDALTQKMIRRRDDLMRAGMKYYRFISQDALINGTEQAEIFEFTNAPDGAVQLSVFDKQAKGRGRLIYQRTFFRPDTYKITLYGLGGGDEFIVSNGVCSRIRLFIAPAAKDNYKLDGKMKVRMLEAE